MINWEVQIIPNFALREARCHGEEGNLFHDCGLIIIDTDLLEPLYLTRIEFGMPIFIGSWTRCYSHNNFVGGEEDSYHLNGRAVDLRGLYQKDLPRLEWCAKKYFPFVKRYSTHLHCDVRGERPCR